MATVPSTWSWDDGQPTFSVELAALAVNNLDGTFGTPVRIPSVKAVMTDFKTITDQAQGDSSITAIASQLISADLTLDFSGITRAAYTILTGVSTAASVTPTRYVTDYHNDRFPYFALILEALAAEASGDTVFFLPKCKITSGFQWKWEYGKIIAPNVKAVAIKDLVLGYTARIVERAAVAAVVLPPV